MANFFVAWYRNNALSFLIGTSLTEVQCLLIHEHTVRTANTRLQLHWIFLATVMVQKFPAIFYAGRTQSRSVISSRQTMIYWLRPTLVRTVAARPQVAQRERFTSSLLRSRRNVADYNHRVEYEVVLSNYTYLAQIHEAERWLVEYTPITKTPSIGIAVRFSDGYRTIGRESTVVVRSCDGYLRHATVTVLRIS